MNSFPRYGSPFQFYNPYYRNNFYQRYQPASEKSPPVTSCSNNESDSKSEDNRSSHKSNDTVWFDIFGIKLYFDDVLILSLLFFLYEEEVKDEGLFLALVLLLIS